MASVDENSSGMPPTGGGKRPVKKSVGQKVREGSLYSASTIIITYPIVGFALGFLCHKLWGWPVWISMITTILGLVQAIREVYKLSKKVYGDDGP